MTVVVQLYALAAAGVAALLLLAMVLAMVLLAVGDVVRVLIIEPCQGALNGRRDAFARAADAARTDAEATDAVRRLEQTYVDAANQIRREAGRSAW